MATLYVNQAWASLSNGEKVTVDGVEYTFGTDAFASISAAIDAGAENIVILSDITDSVESLAGITLSTTVPGGVKVTNTYGGYLYLSGGNQIGENITWDNTQGYLFAYNDNTVNGNILVYCPYTRYDGTLTIGTTGSMTFTEQFVIRYADSDTEPLLSIQGTAQLGAAAEDRTAQLISNAGYITFYSGIVEASNTLVNGGHLAMTQTTDASYSDKAAVLNLDNTIWNFSSNDLNSAYLDGKALINATNGSVLNFNDDLIINGTESGLSVTDSVVNVFNGGVTNNGTISISGESTLNIQQLTGSGSIKLEDGAVITDSTIGGGTVELQGTATFKGVNSIGTLSVSGYNHNLIIGTDGSLKANGGRTTLSYGSTIDVDGTIENAKTADKANLTKSLEITGGFSFTGNGTYNGVDATLNVDNAYVSFGSSTSKNNKATGNFVFNFTNSIVDFTADFQTAASTVNTLDPYFSLNVKDSVFSIGTRFAFSHENSTAVIDNSLFSTAQQFKNVGEFTLQNGSVMTVGSNADGPSYEKTGNFGTLNIIDSVFDFSAAATSAAYAFYNAGTVYVDGGEFYSDYVKNEGSFIVTDEGTVEVKSFTNNGTITIDVAEGWTGAKVVINAQDGTTFGNVVIAEEDALAGVQYRVDSENGDLIVYNVDANTLYVDADYTGAFGEDLGDGKYFGINVFANLNDAVAAAADGNTLQLSGTISSSAVFANGKDLTITGEAEFSWADGWFFVGRGADNAVDTTVTFRDAVISEGKEYAWNIGTGFNVAQSEGEGSGKANGTLNIENSKIITTYLANRNIVNVKGDGIEDGVYGYNGEANLTVLNGFYVSRDNDDELNAEMNLTDGAYVRVEWENGMGIGYGDGRGVLNITDSKFEAAGDQVLTNPGDLTVEANGAINVTNGELTVQNNLRNNGSINIAGSKLTAASVSGTGSFTIGAGASELNIGSLQQNIYANQNSDEAILLTGSVNTSKTLRVYGDATLDDLSVNGDYVGALVSGTGAVSVYGNTLITGNTVMNLNAFQTTNSGVIDKDVVINTANFNAYDMGAANDGTVVDAQFIIKGTLNTVSFIVTNDYYSAGGEDELIVAEDAVLSVTYQSGNGRYSLQTGKVTIYGYANANLSSGGGYSNFGSGAGYAMNLTIDGTYAAEDNNNGKFIKVGTQNLGIYEESSVNLVNGAQFQWQGGVVTNYAQINIVNSSFEATKLVNEGIVAVDLSSTESYQFKVDTLVNNGTLSFTFDAGKEIEGGMMLLVDANSASEYGEVIFNGISDDYDAVVINGDLYVFDTKKIYVNAAYASYSAGDKIAEGIYFGINAFASFETINADLTEAARTIEFTYNGSEAVEITVTSAGSSTLSYNFEGQSANFISGSRTHTISEEGVYTFDFAKGDFELATRIFELNESEEITGDNIADEDVVVNEYAGNKEYTFEVGANTTGKLTCTYGDVDGSVRAQVIDADGNVVREKIFNRDGSFVVADLEEGSYKVVFSGYGNNPDAEFTASFEYVETAIADFTQDDTLEGSNVLSYLAGLEFENKVGGEDSVDWFRIEDIESGSYNLSFDIEGGDGLKVALYNEINGVSKTIATFSVNDTNVDVADYIRKAKVAADADLLIKISGRGDETKYTIAINPV